MNTKKWFCSLLVAIVSLFGIAMLAACGESKTPTEGAETGVYYYDAVYDEFMITLNSGDKFSFVVKGANKSGTYALDGETLTFTFYKEEDQTVTAQYKDDAISLTYEGESMRFLKKINRTVKFETGEGSNISDVTVINGKAVAQPEDPTRSGYIFTGWFADSEYKTPFDFAAQKITADTTVYARWAKTGQTVVGQSEFEVSFDLNYENAEELESVKTIGGKVYGLPETPVREGYTFVGWWVSMSNSAEELSYKFDEEATLGENTTLFAVWSSNATSAKLSAPAVSVYSNKIEWVGSSSANGYQIKIVRKSNGAVVYDGKVDGSSYAVDFSKEVAGDYEVTVTALAASGAANNSDPTVRLYKNKALDRVSLFEVAEPSVLVFNRVPNAETYYVTLVCGNSDHDHEEVYNGNSTVFSFANCAMSKDGLKFTVRAHADGYADSVSEVFTFSRDLAAIPEVVYDKERETFVWDTVPFATEYVVTVKSGDEVLATVNVGTATSFCVKGFAPADLTVSVVPQTFGYNSPEATQATAKKDTLAAPENLKLEGTTLVWDEVAGAPSYEVEVAGKTETVTAAEFDLTTVALDRDANTVRVRALPAEGSQNKASLYSDAYSVGGAKIVEASLRYENGVLSWAPVLNANGYTVTVNGKSATVSTNSYDATADLKAGENKFTVKFNDEAGTSNEVEYKVFLYSVVVTDSGNTTSPVITLYKRAGDTIELTHGEKLGYEFDNWYNVPGGAGANGAKYESDKFGGGSDLYLYAYYTPKTYTVTLKLPDGTEVGTAEVTYDRPFTLPVTESPDPDKEFNGYNGLANATGAEIADSEGNGYGNWKFAEDRDVYVVWRNPVLVYEEIYVDGTTDVVKGYSVSFNDDLNTDAYRSLTSINIPQSYKGKPILEISGNAFSASYWLDRITSINFYDTVLEIGPNAFGQDNDIIFEGQGLYTLNAVNVIPVEGNREARYASEDGILFDYGKADDRTDKLADLFFIPRNKAGEYKIPNYVKTINPTVFRNSRITEITIPTSVTTIGNSAFENCSYLETVIFENLEATEGVSALTIQDRAFYGCTALESITLPARVGALPLSKFTYYSKYTDHVAGQPTSRITADQDAQSNITDLFYRCSNLKEIAIAGANSLYSAKDGVLLNKSGDTILYYPAAKEGAYTIPNGVKTVASGAFFEAGGLTALTVPGAVTLLSDSAFYGCPNLTEVTVKSSIASAGLEIGKNAFRECDRLEAIVFETGANVKTIGVGAFMECNSLTEVELPKTVTSIQESAFENCEYLEKLSVQDNMSANAAPLVYGDNVFSNCDSLTEVYLPAQASTYPYYVESPLVAITISPDNKFLASENSIMFNADKTELFKYGSDATTYEIPATVKKIATGAFKGTAIESVTIPASVTEIGESAFEGCESLTTVTFITGGTDDLVIGDSAFLQCPITELTIPARTVSIGNMAFTHYDMLYGYYYMMPKTGLTSLTFEANSRLETIGEGAFIGALIPTVTIPASVVTIGNEAFSNTYLQTVNFESNSKLESIGESAFAVNGFKDSDRGNFVSRLTSVTNIPKTVKEIRAFAFAYSRNLETVTFEAGGTDDLVFGESVEGYEDLGYVEDEGDLDDTYDMYFGQVFAYCDALASIELPARTVRLGYGMFLEDGALRSVSFKIAGETEDSRLTFIDMKAFSKSGIESITIPDSVFTQTVDNSDVLSGQDFYRNFFETAIRKSAFEGCIELTSVTFGSGKNEIAIGNYAFKDCTALSAIELPASLTSIGRDGKESTSRVNVFDGCTQLASISIAESNATYASKDGVLYTKDFTTLIMCPQGKTGEFTFISELETVADGGLENLGGITAVVVSAGFNNLTSALLNSFATGQIVDEYFDWDNYEYVYVYEYSTSVTEIRIDSENRSYSAEGLIVYDKAKTKLLFTLQAGIEGTLSVSEGVTEIGDEAFATCSSLTEVTLPASLRVIGASAFRGTGITEITVPANVETMGEAVFKDCSDLATLTFADGCKLTALPLDAFTNDESLTAIRIPAKVTEVPAVFDGCKALETVTFEEGSVCTRIADEAFLGEPIYWGTSDDKLKTVELPASLTYIGKAAFEYRYNLTSVGTIPAGVTKIQDETFKSCESLTNVTLSEGLEEIGESAFYSCKNLTALTVPSTIRKIGESAFLDDENLVFTFNGLTNLTEIGESAFYGCKQLTSFTVPAGVTIIPEWAFYNCSNLAKVELHDAITTIGGNAFQNTALSEIELPDALQRVEYGFCDLPNLTKITIGKDVSFVSNDSRTGLGVNCPKLSEIVVSGENGTYESYKGALYTKGLTEAVIVPAGLTTWELPAALAAIPANAISQIAATEIVTPSGNIVYESYKGALYTKGLTEAVIVPKGLTTWELPAALTTIPANAISQLAATEITVAEGNETYAAYDGALYNSDYSKLIKVPSGHAETLALAPNCTAVERNALAKRITTLTITANHVAGLNGEFFTQFTYLTTIETEAECVNYLASDGVLYSADGTTLIAAPQKASFTGGAYTLLATTKKLDAYAFYECSNLTSLTLNEGLESIGDCAFYNTGLSELTLPASVKFVERYAFDSCYSLRKLVLEGTDVQFLDYDPYGTFSGTAYRFVIVVNGTEYDSYGRDEIINEDGTIKTGGN